jgi:hypothetical protein
MFAPSPQTIKSKNALSNVEPCATLIAVEKNGGLRLIHLSADIGGDSHTPPAARQPAICGDPQESCIWPSVTIK